MKKGHAATSRWEASRPPHRFDLLPAIQVAPQCTQGHIPEFLQLSQGFATALSNCESLNAEDDCNQRLPGALARCQYQDLTLQRAGTDTRLLHIASRDSQDLVC